jgi:hypothetical protein
MNSASHSNSLKRVLKFDLDKHTQIKLKGLDQYLVTTLSKTKEITRTIHMLSSVVYNLI